VPFEKGCGRGVDCRAPRATTIAAELAMVSSARRKRLGRTIIVIELTRISLACVRGVGLRK